MDGKDSVSRPREDADASAGAGCLENFVVSFDPSVNVVAFLVRNQTLILFIAHNLIDLSHYIVGKVEPGWLMSEQST